MKNLLFNLLDWILPERMVRTLFISSLYSRLFKVKVLDDRVYHQVNEVLKVSSNDAALGLGMHLEKVFWNDVEMGVLRTEMLNGKVVLTEETREEMIRQIIEKTPNWLRYNRADMEVDIRTLIKRRMELPLAVA